MEEGEVMIEQRVGKTFDALVISVAKYGLFVELEKYFIEGLVPIDTLPNDRYLLSREHAQDHRRAVAAEFSIGDLVHVSRSRRCART